MRQKLDAVWPGFAKVFGLLVLITLFFLVGQSMVRHHFFSGGAQDYHNRPTGP
jgi:uncharacterized membrane protein